jgi:hypothetical protein
MPLRLVDSGWDSEISHALRVDHANVRIICPFIKQRAAKRLLEHGRPDRLRILTRFDLAAFARGVSDTSALRLLMDAGARVRGVRGLHAKVYLLGAARAIVTSANLTEAGLGSNHEFGVVTDEAPHLETCTRYFKRHWRAAAPNLSYERLDEWEVRLQAIRDRGTPPSEIDRLPDEGAVVSGVPPEPVQLPPAIPEADQVFVKFFGQARNRAPREMSVLDEVAEAGCHWACTYPASSRPRQVHDGDVLFMGRMVKRPRDTMIFGWAIGQEHVEGRDDATRADLNLRPWKVDWPHYVRVYGAEFLDCTLGDGVSFYELLDALGPRGLATTSDHLAAGSGNTDPRRAYNRQPAVRLSAEGAGWIAHRLQRGFERHGTLTRAMLETLDWPAPLPGVRNG